MANEVSVGADRAGSAAENEVVTEIHGLILNAINETLRRACKEHGSDQPRVLDQKPDLESEGMLQDCEFGLMLITGEAWLRDRGVIHGELSDQSTVQRVIISLLRRTLERLTEESGDFIGGEFESERTVFFSGEPYTRYRPPRSRVDLVYANLDAAMLVVAFFSAALEKYDRELANLALPENHRLKEKLGLGSVREGALFICKEGLRYATECRVEADGALQGFTSDPAGRNDAKLLNAYDRLFFTWTTCETIRELLNWKKDYLDRLKPEGVARTLVAETTQLLAALENDIEAASRWCQTTMLEGFRSLRAFNVGAVVRAFRDLDNRKPGPDLQEQVNEVQKYVEHVYHLSQYAAVRSIAPVDLTLDEVRDVADRLDTLVAQHVLSTGLDVDKRKELSGTLTRYYALAWAERKQDKVNPYQDDAFYPLVVRSLAGLLTRTLTALRKSGAKRDEIVALIYQFRQVLKKHFDLLKERRPKKNEPGDENLWAFASDFPYALYATQRTVFALQEYAEFLEAMAAFEREDREVVDTGQIETHLRELLARSLADLVVGPVVQDFVRRTLALRPASVPSAKPEPPPLDSRLPDWAQEPVSQWLDQLPEALEGIGNLVKQQVELIVYCWEESRRQPRKEKLWTRELFAKLGLDADRLDKEDGLNAGTLMPVVFAYHFRNLMRSFKENALSDQPVSVFLEGVRQSRADMRERSKSNN